MFLAGKPAALNPLRAAEWLRLRSGISRNGKPCVFAGGWAAPESRDGPVSLVETRTSATTEVCRRSRGGWWSQSLAH